MHSKIFVILVGVAISSSALADHERREERRQDRHEEHREDRHERREGPRAAPPAVRVERHNTRRGYLWVGGNYEWRGDGYVWIPGRYEAERRGYRWREPRWETREGVYIHSDGGWDIIAPVAAPPPLREERWETRTGFVYIRGAWDWQGGQWAWLPGHYERERVGQTWRAPRWESRNGVYISVQGVWQ